MARKVKQVTCGDIETRGTCTTSGWCDEMVGCKGKTYAERKLNLLKQLGYHNVPKDIFDGLTETEIDRKARSIIFA